MDKARQIALLKDRTGEQDDALLDIYLDMAAEEVLNRAYPFRTGDEDVAVPRRYVMLQVEIATYLLNKRGAEGQLSHSENGISRSYERAGVPESLLKQIMPRAKIFNAGGD